MKIPNFATEKNRWFALVFLSLSLAIVIIDNNVLNVAIPYILRDLKTNFGAIQWVISGYALIIATILITVGRLGDAIGRKKLFLIGLILFALGSFIASVSPNVIVLFIGEAFIEAFGAAMMMTSSLALLVTEFQGRERAIAFGIWGSIAGASASLGPLLGGYLTTYYSWRWSLRINVIIAIIAILGSVFIKEAKGKKAEKFDWMGTLYSGLGLFLLVFGFIEGRILGWWKPMQPFGLFGWQWPLTSVSITPFVFLLSALFLVLFVWNEYVMEKVGGEPLLRLSLFKNIGFTMGLITLGIVVMGQFGAFFIFPLYYQNVLGWNAFQTGVVFLWTSIAALIVGPASGVFASKYGPKWVVSTGMLASFIGVYWISNSLSVNATSLSLAPALIVLGIGIGMASAQLTNIILSHVPQQFSGEASAVNATFRQVGTSIGIAVLGTVLASSLSANIVTNVQANAMYPSGIRQQIMAIVRNVNAESGAQSIQQSIPKHPICADGTNQCISSVKIFTTIKKDVNQGLVDAAKTAFRVGLVFVAIGMLCSLFIPEKIPSRSSFETEEIKKTH
jgi:EmrB/QacA subfamily drug resistance transporter